MMPKGDETKQYQDLVEQIRESMLKSSQMTIAAKRDASKALQDIGEQARRERRRIMDLKEKSQREYQAVADMFCSEPFASLGVRLLPTARPIRFQTDVQALSKQEVALFSSIKSTLVLYGKQSKLEAEAARRAREAALAALQARRSNLSVPEKPVRVYDVKKIAFIIGLVLVIVSVAAVVVFMVMK